MNHSPSAPVTQGAAWHALQQHLRELQPLHLRQMFAADSTRGERLTLHACGIYLDYSKNRITGETLRIDGGMLTSQVRPPTNSARLHSAIACTVPM